MANKKVCDICLKSNDDPALYGEFVRGKHTMNVHYYCLLSSPAPQRGKDNEGIRGYLEEDIFKTILESDEKQCYICFKKSAAVSCAHPGCHRNFHFICGRQNDCITQFIGNFNSFCHQHVPDTNKLSFKRHVTCIICDTFIIDYHPAKAIVSNCCVKINGHYADFKENCFLHSTCIQKYVHNAGYDSMCCLCPMHEVMSREQWQNQMRKKGIFVPMKMAEWEKEPHFKDMVKRKCSKSDCLYATTTRKVYTCFVCGCIPLHLQCAQVKKHEDYLCPKCFDQSFVQRVPKY